MKPTLLPILALVSLLSLTPLPAEEVISVNFSESTADALGPASVAGDVPRAVWNNAVGAGGSLSELKATATEKDTTGKPTQASLTWKSATTFHCAVPGDTPLAQLFKGYLDDGPTSGSSPVGNYGAQVTVENIPWDNYLVYLYVASGENKEDGPGGSVPMLPFEVNGRNYTASKSTKDESSPTKEGNERWTGEGIATPPLLEGRNYLLVQGLGARTLTIRGYAKNRGIRGSLTGLQIVENIQRTPPPNTGYRWGW
jgi:hypothetical protein